MMLEANAMENLVSNSLLSLEQNLSAILEARPYEPKVKFIYNPINYAHNLHVQFLQKYMNTPKPILFLGMNPGPWGMGQTGVPFGDIITVRDWMLLSGDINRPAREHPKRPIEGLHCTRREVSGERFWTLMREVCGSPQQFFKHCAVYNHCPLLYLSESGKNLTPVDLNSACRRDIQQICDVYLKNVLQLLQVKVVVGIGRYAEKRAKEVAKTSLDGIQIHFLPHPSPASATANRGWNEIARRKLNEIGLLNLLSAT